MTEITGDTLSLYGMTRSEMDEAQELSTYCSRKWDVAEMTKPEIITYIETHASTTRVAIVAGMGAAVLMCQEVMRVLESNPFFNLKCCSIR